MSSNKRLTKEFAELSQDLPPGYTSLSLPADSSLHTWHLVLTPPETSPYHPGRFALVLSLPPEYPFKPPVARFATRIYHPNVTDEACGSVCLAVTKQDVWKPASRIKVVLDAVANLLLEPQPDDPLEQRIADEYRNDKEAWLDNVKKYVKMYAMGEPTFPSAQALAASSSS
ncbi:hypothetical protein CDD81_3450 [Ophiocordyceps australis]|uniref:UBC core domain-containing protein n=1 Tax=Ophiocordyceps australis TaxID=1399860 RepID=A0A2C5YCQ5_9HYPO|nr:hypothetical protein CDD81_3450 [Ophiocordyceps australis]